MAVECGFFDFAIPELPPFGEQIVKTACVRPSVPSGGYDVLKMADREFDSAEGNSDVSYGRIYNDAILSPSSWKKYRRSTGLPGKLPVSRLVWNPLRPEVATDRVVTL